MKKLFTTLLLWITFQLQSSAQNSASFIYFKDITIDHTKVSGNSNLTNFPVLISLTDADLRTTSNGGKLHNSNGYDLLFANSTGTTDLLFQIESYNASTGALVAWVNIPVLSHNTNTVIRMYYGKPGVINNPSSLSTWNNNYAGVWHLNGEFNDATSNANDGINYSTGATTGKIAGARSLNGSTQYIDFAQDNSLKLTTGATVSAWVNRTGSDGHIINMGGGWSDFGYSLFWFGNSIRIELQRSGEKTISDNSAPSQNNWHHIAFTWSNVDNTIRTFINGTQQASTAIFNGPLGNPTQNLQIGKNANQGSYIFGGNIDEARVMNTAVSAAWLETEYNNQNDPSGFYTVGEEQSLSVTINIVKHVGCHGATDANIEAIVTNGAAPYEYNWGAGITTASRNNLSAGTYNVTVTDALGSTATTSAIVTQPALGQGTGNPNVFGDNVWNVYVWNAGNGTGGNGAWTDNYSGYYVIDNLNFDTRPGQTYSTPESWATEGSPANALGYQGCEVANDNHSYAFKRQGFDCGIYQINLPNHDDRVELHVNGTMVYSNNTCCAERNNIWSGYLNSSSTLELRISEQGGSSFGAIELVKQADIEITAATPASRCGTGTVVLEATASAGSTIDWYAAATGGTVLAGGTGTSNFTTPSISSDTYFYAEARHIATGSVCARTPVLASTSGVGNPNNFGDNVWNVYVWNAGNASGGNGSWTSNYSGYYVINSLNFDTRMGQAYSTAQSWDMNGTPSSALGYQGCAVGVDNHSYAFKRQGFPCGNYRINLPNHDDRVQLYVDGAMVYDLNGCCAARNNIWTGFLGANSTVELRIAEGAGQSIGAMELVKLNDVEVASVTNNNRCGSGTLTLNATANTGNTIDWYEAVTGGAVLTNGSATTSFITPSLSNTTTYYVEARNVSTGCVSSARTAVVATVTPAINANIIVNKYPWCSTCINGEITVEATGGTSPLSYNWGGGITTATRVSLGTGNYEVTVTDGAACTAIESVELTVDPTIPVGAFIWIGGTSNNYATSGNWSGNTVPTSTSDVYVPAGTVNSLNISSGNTLTVKDIHIDENASITFGNNNSEIDINGDMYVTGCSFIQTTGRVTFSGNVAQYINADCNVEFRRLYIENTSSTGVYLNGASVLVNNQLHLLDGYVYTNNDTLFVTNTSATNGIRNFNEDESHVVGYLTRRLVRNNNTYAFPVGKGSENTSFLFSIKNNNMDAVTSITAIFRSLDADTMEIQNALAGLNITEDNITYSRMCPEGMWTIEPNTQPTGGSYNFIADVKNFTSLINEKFGVLKKPTSSGVGNWNTGSGTLANEIGGSILNGLQNVLNNSRAQRNSLTSFSDFGMGGEGGSNPLPIELLSFSAAMNDDKTAVDLLWITATEINNEVFVIQRSLDGENFEEIGRVTGAGNSTSQLSYKFVDVSPLQGVVYYRLKQIDFDGTYTYSKLAGVANTTTAITNKPEMKLFPNPTNGVVNILLNSEVSEFEIQVIDITGIIVFSKKVINENAEVFESIELNNELKSGFYFLRMVAPNLNLTKKIQLMNRAF